MDSWYAFQVSPWAKMLRAGVLQRRDGLQSEANFFRAP